MILDVRANDATQKGGTRMTDFESDFHEQDERESTASAIAGAAKEVMLEMEALVGQDGYTTSLTMKDLDKALDTIETLRDLFLEAGRS